MAELREMEEMLVCAPMGPGEALVPVLCVEASASTQEALEKAVRAMTATVTDAAGGGSGACASPSSSPTGASAALQALRKLPGTRLRVSPYTTVHVLRSFLEAEETGAAAAGAAAAGAAASSAGAGASRAKAASRSSLASAQFFAVRVPAAAREVRVSGGGDANDDADADADVLLALHHNTTLQEVLCLGRVLRLPEDASSPAAVSDDAATLVLLYARESQYGDFDGGDILCIGLCAAMCACCIACCVSSAASAAQEKKQQQKYEQQQHQQNQNHNHYYQNQQQQQGGYQNYNNHQPTYQGPQGAPNAYGAPPPANGYPVAQPAYYNYSGDPSLAQQPSAPPAQYYNANPNYNQQQQGYYQQPGQGGSINYPGTANPNNGYPSTAPL